MVTISNQQRDNAVDFLRRLVDLTQSLEKGSLRVTNLRRRARILASQLEKKPKTQITDSDKDDKAQIPALPQ